MQLYCEDKIYKDKREKIKDKKKTKNNPGTLNVEPGTAETKKDQ
jgi:hypothetical protein